MLSQREVLQGLMESKTLAILLKFHLQYFLSGITNMNVIYVSKMCDISFCGVVVLVTFAC